MDASQITGTASSYAGKRALGNLFALDNDKDADALGKAEKPVPEGVEFQARCKVCGTAYTFRAGTTREELDRTPCACQHPTWQVL